ncbi:methylated-DNA--[protein]-cysteine S-methyltransferase [Variovorax ureilyticus]|uniref:Methylated-DNA--[protein]-cysteine S-methyltransferase n=1 Tax=Variovorax ureilyticus TaxID=1836198 RepID=A0ABU8V7I5_9BURK
MNPTGFALFTTAIGACGIAWGPRGLVGVQLPEAGDSATRARMARRFPALNECEPPPEVQRAMASIRALLQGEPLDLAEIELDLDGVSEFHQRVYAIARRIPPGRTRTYGDIAEELGDKGLARAVGQALGLNPFAPVVPCHRVLAAGGKWGGFSAHGGAASKLRMLAIEGARPESGTAPLF